MYRRNKKHWIVPILLAIFGMACTYSKTGPIEQGQTKDGKGIQGDTKNEDGEGGALKAYRDADGDGYGNSEETKKMTGEMPPEGYVKRKGDCDDTKKDVHPGVTEILSDGIDQNCDQAFARVPTTMTMSSEEGNHKIQGTGTLRFNPGTKAFETTFSVTGLHEENPQMLENFSVKGSYDASHRKMLATLFQDVAGAPKAMKSYEWSHDEKWKLSDLMEKEIEDAGTYFERYEYQYNASGTKISEKKSSGPEGTPPTSVSEKNYDAEGHLMSWQETGMNMVKNGEPIQSITKTENTYDPKGNILTKVITSDGVVKRSMIFEPTYDAQGNAIQELVKQAGEVEPTYIIERTFDASGNKTKEVYKGGGPKAEVFSTDEWTYFPGTKDVETHRRVTKDIVNGAVATCSEDIYREPNVLLMSRIYKGECGMNKVAEETRNYDSKNRMTLNAVWDHGNQTDHKWGYNDSGDILQYEMTSYGSRMILTVSNYIDVPFEVYQLNEFAGWFLPPSKEPVLRPDPYMMAANQQVGRAVPLDKVAAEKAIKIPAFQDKALLKNQIPPGVFKFKKEDLKVIQEVGE